MIHLKSNTCLLLVIISSNNNNEKAWHSHTFTIQGEERLPPSPLCQVEGSPLWSCDTSMSCTWLKVDCFVPHRLQFYSLCQRACLLTFPPPSASEIGIFYHFLPTCLSVGKTGRLCPGKINSGFSVKGTMTPVVVKCQWHFTQFHFKIKLWLHSEQEGWILATR